MKTSKINKYLSVIHDRIIAWIYHNFRKELKEKTLFELIDDEAFKETVLKQFNYMRIKGINLVQDADDMVNLYLKITKQFDE